MKCYSGWSYHPYAPLTERRNVPVIVRLAPSEDGIRYEFIDGADTGGHTVELGTLSGAVLRTETA